MRAALWVAMAAVLVAGAGCAGAKQRRPVAPIGSGTGTGTTAKPVSDDVGPPAEEQRIQLPKENHVVEIVVPGRASPAKSAVVTVSVRATGGMWMVPEAPHKLEVTAPAGATVNRVVNTKDSLSFEVWFTPTQAGPLSFTAQLRSHTCNDTICNAWRDELSWTVPVE